MKKPCVRCTLSMEEMEGMFQGTEKTLDMTVGVSLAVEKLKEESGGSRQAEVS